MPPDDPLFRPPPPRTGSGVKPPMLEPGVVPPPPPDYNIAGFYIAETRIRGGWFGIAIVEELTIYRSGERCWRRAPGAILKIADRIKWKSQ